MGKGNYYVCDRCALKVDADVDGDGEAPDGWELEIELPIPDSKNEKQPWDMESLDLCPECMVEISIFIQSRPVKRENHTVEEGPYR